MAQPADKSKQYKDAIRVLLVDMTPAAATALVQVQAQSDLYDAEVAKTHPLTGFSMTAPAFTALCAFLRDGGGVLDDMATVTGSKSLTGVVWQAIHDGDQTTFWSTLPQLLKSWVKQRGLMAQVAGTSAVIATGFDATPTPKAAVSNDLNGPQAGSK